MKPKLHGVRVKVPTETYTLIEITGQIDVGKRAIATALARRLNCPLIAFPHLDPSSYTGRALLAALTTKPELLESAPYWWAHIYCANIFERKAEIEESLKNGPVVVLNYMYGCRAWMKAAGLVNTRGYFTGMPQPTIVYSLVGDKWKIPQNLENKFSTDFMLRVDRSMSSSPDGKIIRIPLNRYTPARMYKRINEAVETILGDLNKRYGIDEATSAKTRLTNARAGVW